MRFLAILVMLLTAVGCGDTPPPSSTAPSPYVPPPPVPSGSLDPGFGTDGSVRTVAPGLLMSPVSLTCDADFVYMFGYTWSMTTPMEGRIEKRRKSDGAPDPAFGAGGVIAGAGGFNVFGLAVDSDWLYIAGFTNAAGITYWRIEKRAVINGSYDPGFGVGGVVTEQPLPGWSAAPSEIVIDTTSMYILGYEMGPNWSMNVRLEKRNLGTGALDPSFGTDGVVSDPSIVSLPKGLALHNGSLAVLLWNMSGVSSALWRLEKRSSSTGALDPAFGTAGVIEEIPGLPMRVTLAGNDLYVLGSADPGVIRLEKRRFETGALDVTFGIDGAVSPGGQTIAWENVVADPDAVYVSGADYATSDPVWLLEKRASSDGVRDAAFGTGGVITQNPTAAYELPAGLALDGQFLFWMGTLPDPVTNSWGWRLEKRYK